MHVRLSLWIFFAQTFAYCADLPSSIVSALPPCALDCLEVYVYHYFPTSICSDTTDLDCLCTAKTTSGFALGEAALRCLISSCTNTLAFQQKAYDICDGVNGALPLTHSTLTATLMATATLVPSALTSGITEQPTGEVPTSIITGPGPTGSAAASHTTSATMTTSITSSVVSPTATAEPQINPGTAATSDDALTTGRIVGIAVGGVAGAVLILAIIAVVIRSWRSKRRAKEEEEADWPMDNDKEHPLSPSSQGLRPDSRAAQQAMAQPVPPAAPPKDESRRSFWRKSVQPEDIGVAVSPEIIQQSPVSIASNKTTARLLPDMPRYTIWPSVFHTPEQVEPQTKKRKSVEPAEVERLPAPRIVSSRTGNGMPSDPRARMYAMERDRNVGRIPLTPVYDNGLPSNFNRPVPGGPGQNQQLQVPTGSREPSTNFSVPLPKAERRTSGPSFQRPGPSVPTRASSRYSNASESTTFEIDDYEYDRDSTDAPIEPSVPQPSVRNTQYFRPTQSMLSPVVESPRVPPPQFPMNIDDPFITPTRQTRKENSSPQFSPSRGLGLNPYSRSPSYGPTLPTIRLADPIPPPKKLQSPKDEAVAAGQSFLASDGSTPESETGSGDSCSQPSTSTPPENPSLPAMPIMKPPAQLQSPFRQMKPIAPPAQVHLQQENLLAKRRGSVSSSILPPEALRISPDAANRGRQQRSPQQLGHSSKQRPFVDDDPELPSMWESIGRDRYAAALRPPPPPRSEASDDSYAAVVGMDQPPKSPFGTRVTPTRKGGDLYLRVG